MEVLKKNQKNMLEKKNSVREIKNTFNRFIARCKTAQKRISELEYNEMQIEKGIKKLKTDHLRISG